MNGAPGVQRVRSTSGIGLAIVYIEFGWDSEIFRARQLVAERLTTLEASLPEGVTPVMGPVTSIMGEVMLVGLVSKGRVDDGTTSPLELRALADWVLRPRLLTIPGVAQVIPIGAGVKQVQVLVDPARLFAFHLTLEEVQRAAGLAQANTTGASTNAQLTKKTMKNFGQNNSY